MNAKHYAYRVVWSEEDQEFVGLCAEFPSLSWLDGEQGAALEGIVRLVAATLADLEASGEPVPQPLSLTRFSGNISFRTTPDTHRALAMAAAERGVSLNRLLNALVARQ